MKEKTSNRMSELSRKIFERFSRFKRISHVSIIRATMSSKPNIQLLQAYQPFLRILKIYNSENFSISAGRRIFIHNIGKAIIFLLLFFNFFLFFLSAMFFCIEFTRDLPKLAQPLSILLCQIQITSIFASMVWSNRIISEALDRIQGIIVRRN